MNVGVSDLTGLSLARFRVVRGDHVTGNNIFDVLRGAISHQHLGTGHETAVPGHIGHRGQGTRATTHQAPTSSTDRHSLQTAPQGMGARAGPVGPSLADTTVDSTFRQTRNHVLTQTRRRLTGGPLASCSPQPATDQAGSTRDRNLAPRDRPRGSFLRDRVDTSTQRVGTRSIRGWLQAV